MRATTTTTIALWALLLSTAQAETPQAGAADDNKSEASRVEPRVMHTVLARAAAGKDLIVVARVQGDWRLKTLQLRARPVGGAFEDFPFERTRVDEFRARVPARLVERPGLEYAIVSVGADGARRDHFASDAAPYPVQITGTSGADRQRQQLARFKGQRSRFSARGEMAFYGSRITGDTQTDRFSDRYWLSEVEYLYRPLTILHDFRFGTGWMRAQWPSVDGERQESTADPGVTYAFAELNLEPHRWFSFGARLILGVDEEGFATGLGGIARVGDLARTHFAARTEWIDEVGTRTDLRLHWTTVPRFPMSLGVEFTDWPAGDQSTSATNLSYDLGWEFTDQWTAVARVGTAKRNAALDGGYSGGLTLRYGF
jgi:hypothetical protein